MHSRLRLFDGDDQALSSAQAASPFDGSFDDELGAKAPMVAVPFGEMLAALAEALVSDSAFLMDFAEDEVQLTPDLYDVLIAFRRMRDAA